MSTGKEIAAKCGNGMPVALDKRSSPTQFFAAALGRPVTIKTGSSAEYKGVMAAVDGFLNVALEQAVEYVDGMVTARYGDAFIRGNNSLSPTFFVCQMINLTVFISQLCTSVLISDGCEKLVY